MVRFLQISKKYVLLPWIHRNGGSGRKGHTYYSRKEFFGPDGVLSKVTYYGHGATNLYPLTIYSDVEPSVEMISALKEKGFDVYILRSDHC